MAGVNRTSRELRLSLSLRMRVSESWVSVCVCWLLGAFAFADPTRVQTLRD